MDKRTRLERLDALHRSRRGGRGVSKPPNLPPGRGGGGGSSSSTPSSLRGKHKKSSKKKGSPDDDDDDVARLVPAHVLQSLKVPAKKDGGARDLETLLETLLATNPKLNQHWERPEETEEVKLPDKNLVWKTRRRQPLVQARNRHYVAGCRTVRQRGPCLASATGSSRRTPAGCGASRASKVEDLGFHRRAAVRVAGTKLRGRRGREAAGRGPAWRIPSTLEPELGDRVEVKIRNYDGVCGVVLDASSGSLTVVSRDGRPIPLRGSVFGWTPGRSPWSMAMRSGRGGRSGSGAMNDGLHVKNGVQKRCVTSKCTMCKVLLPQDASTPHFPSGLIPKGFTSSMSPFLIKSLQYSGSRSATAYSGTDSP